MELGELKKSRKYMNDIKTKLEVEAICSKIKSLIMVF